MMETSKNSPSAFFVIPAPTYTTRPSFEYPLPICENLTRTADTGIKTHALRTYTARIASNGSFSDQRTEITITVQPKSLSTLISESPGEVDQATLNVK